MKKSLSPHFCPADFSTENDTRTSFKVESLIKPLFEKKLNTVAILVDSCASGDIGGKTAINLAQEIYNGIKDESIKMPAEGAFVFSSTEGGKKQKYLKNLKGQPLHITS